MASRSRWVRTSRQTFAAAGGVELYDPGAGVAKVCEITISTDAAAEIVAFFGTADADRTSDGSMIAGLFLAANGGASPDLSAVGALAPAAGDPVRLYASAACTVWIRIAGMVDLA